MCLFPKLVSVRLKSGSLVQMQVPCGKCIECLTTRSHDWEFRCKVESDNSYISLFCTLTYNDYFLPQSGVQVKHLQDFFKRLRKKIQFKYYAIGEYGTQFKRPHYHILLFVKQSITLVNAILLLNQTWHFGFVQCKRINQGNIHYCVAYIIGGHTPDGKNKIFTIMSKKPPIGMQIKKDLLLQLYQNDFKFIVRNGKKVHCPRIYKKKFNNQEYDLFDYICNLCNSCKSLVDIKKTYLKNHKVKDVHNFMLTNLFKKDVSEDVKDFRTWLYADRFNRDFILKQRSKKLRND